MKIRARERIRDRDSLPFPSRKREGIKQSAVSFVKGEARALSSVLFTANGTRTDRPRLAIYEISSRHPSILVKIDGFSVCRRGDSRARVEKPGGDPGREKEREEVARPQRFSSISPSAISRGCFRDKYYSDDIERVISSVIMTLRRDGVKTSPRWMGTGLIADGFPVYFYH